MLVLFLALAEVADALVLIDGVDTAMIDSRSFRCQVVVASWADVMSNRSLGENTTLAEPPIRMERVTAGVRLSGAHVLVLELPQGYRTALEERGTNLSVGRRQRIAIARALATNSRIHVLDEAIGALDYEPEIKINRNMQRTRKDRILLIAAPALVAVHHPDRLVTIKEGRPAGDGTHNGLPRNDGRLAGGHRCQDGGVQTAE